MNESFEPEEKKFLFRSTSEILLRDGVEMYDIEDVVDFNQINLPINKIALGNNKSKILDDSNSYQNSNLIRPSNDS